MKKFLLLTCFITVSLALASCGRRNQNQDQDQQQPHGQLTGVGLSDIAGRWIEPDNTITFFVTGRGMDTSQGLLNPFSWSLEDGELEITFDSNAPFGEKFDFSLSDDNMFLTISGIGFGPWTLARLNDVPESEAPAELLSSMWAHGYRSIEFGLDGNGLEYQWSNQDPYERHHVTEFIWGSGNGVITMVTPDGDTIASSYVLSECGDIITLATITDQMLTPDGMAIPAGARTTTLVRF